MDLREAYDTMQKASGITKNRYVRVIRKAKDKEMGWNNSWAIGMTHTIGKTYKVKYADGNGVCLDGTEYSYPFFVLELLPREHLSAFYLDKGKTITFDDDGAHIGILTISHKNMKTISKEYLEYYKDDDS